MRFLAAACIGILMTISSAWGFVVEGPYRATGDAVEDLRRAPRWSANTGSLVETGQRGLGGGLEYVIDDSICETNFIDGSTCDDARRAIMEALARWADGHPQLHFTDITSQMEAGFPLAVLGETHQGGEIDFYGATPLEFPNFRAALTHGYTIFYTRRKQGVTMTNGYFNPVAEGAFESADIRINLARCYFIEEAGAGDHCVHFPTLVFHEIGHALGIGHPEEQPGRNLDNDSNPNNPIDIDCLAPTNGLRQSSQVQGAAVLVGRDVQGPGRWRRGLTYDDAAARDALYPDCNIEERNRFAVRWGAFAMGEDGRFGVARNAWTRALAETDALDKCNAGRFGERRDCQLVDSFDGCFAFARSRGNAATGIWSTANDERSGRARTSAVESCNARGGDCQIEVHLCAFD